MEKIFDIAKDSEQSWGTLADAIDDNFTEVKEELALKFDKTAVKQTTGTSTTEVMSQNAVTTELDSVRSDLSETTDKLTELEGEISDAVKIARMTWKEYPNSSITSNGSVTTSASDHVYEFVVEPSALYTFIFNDIMVDEYYVTIYIFNNSTWSKYTVKKPFSHQLLTNADSVMCRLQVSNTKQLTSLVKGDITENNVSVELPYAKLVRGKNLLYIKEQTKIYGYKDVTGSLDVNANYRASNLIRFPYNTLQKMYVTLPSTAAKFFIIFYDDALNIVGGWGSNTPASGVLDMPNICSAVPKYYGFSFYASSNLTETNCQLELGEEPTPIGTFMKIDADFVSHSELGGYATKEEVPSIVDEKIAEKPIAYYNQSTINVFDKSKIRSGYVTSGNNYITNGVWVVSGYQKLPMTDYIQFTDLHDGNKIASLAYAHLYSGELVNEQTGEGLTYIGNVPDLSLRFRRGDATYIAWTIESATADTVDGKIRQYKEDDVVNLQGGEIIDLESSMSLPRDNEAELLTKGQNIIDNAIHISNDEMQHAHDSHCLVNYVNHIPHLYIVWQGNTTTASEFVTGQKIYLSVINLITMERVKDNEEIVADDTRFFALPRLMKLPNGNVRVNYSDNNGNSYHVDIDNNLSVSGESANMVIPMTNSSAWGTAIALTSNVLKAHIKAVSGIDAPSGARGNMAIMRGTDNVWQKDGKYYQTIELYMSNEGDFGIAMLAESEDCDTWKLYPPINANATKANCIGAECSINWNGSEYVAIARRTGYAIATSEDAMTWNAWASPANFDLVGGSNCVRHSVCYNPDTEEYIMSYAADGYKIRGKETASGRKTLSIARTRFFSKTKAIAKLVDLSYIHYSCITYHKGKYYMTFTCKSKDNGNNDRDTIKLAIFNA